MTTIESREHSTDASAKQENILNCCFSRAEISTCRMISTSRMINWRGWWILKSAPTPHILESVARHFRTRFAKTYYDISFEHCLLLYFKTYTEGRKVCSQAFRFDSRTVNVFEITDASYSSKKWHMQKEYRSHVCFWGYNNCADLVTKLDTHSTQRTPPRERVQDLLNDFIKSKKIGNRKKA